MALITRPFLTLLLTCCYCCCNMASAEERTAVKFVEPFSSDASPSNVLAASMRSAASYLKAYGYLNPRQSNFKAALREFQKFAEIPTTGLLDETTARKMSQPRCGNKDIERASEELPNPMDREMSERKKGRRRKRYAIEGSYWGVTDITYKISKYTGSVRKDEVDDVIGRAFKVWEQSSTLKFAKKSTGTANIEVLFASKSHGDGEPFDGRGQILAHAFFPRYGGDVHFDEEEPWRALQQKGIDLYSVAAHEIGHSLGLKHSENHQSLMAPFYQGNDGGDIRLHDDDIAGLQKLYGKPNQRFSSSRRDGDKGNTQKDGERNSDISKGRTAADPADICSDPRVDAVTVLGNGTTYAFKGPVYWRLNKLTYDKGYPRNITQDWHGLPADLDAAVTDYDGDTYFFKGAQYWLYNTNGQPYKGYPRKISVGLVDTPNDVDAALIWSYNDKPYFFKGRRFWQYSRWGMPATWPRDVDEIFESDGAANRRRTRAPRRVDAALKWTNGKSYLFAGTKYYRLSSWRVMKTRPGYPRDVGEWWFGCKKRRRRRRSLVYNYADK